MNPTFPNQFPAQPAPAPVANPSPFGSIFGGIMHTAPMSGGYSPKLQGGTHKLVLKEYSGKNSDQGMGFILEADFMVASSTDVSLKSGDIRGWPWFIEGPGYTKVYASANSQEFISAVMQSVILDEFPKDANGFVINPATGSHIYSTDAQGRLVVDPRTGQPVPKSAHDVQSFGEMLMFGIFTGIQIAADLVQAFNKRTGQKRTDKNGKDVYNANWKSIPGQSLADMATLRAYLEQSAPAAPVANTAPVTQFQQPAPAPVTQFQQPAPAPIAASAPTAPANVTSVLDALRRKG